MTRPTLYTAGISGRTGDDEFYANVSALLHMDGANGGTTFTDSGPLNQTVSSFGNAQTSTSQSVFGGASLLLDGSGDYLTMPDGEAFEFGSGDFTMECRFRYDTTPGISYFVMSKSTTGSFGSFYIEVTSGNQLRFTASTDGASPDILNGATISTTLSTNTWYALAFVRSGTNFYGYLDGTRTSLGTSASALDDNGNAFSIGRNLGTSDNDFDGYIDELRVTKGVARYTTASYTPSTAAFPDG